MDPAPFGTWLRAQRRQHDMTRKEFAAKLGCGVSTLAKLEQGQRRPSKALFDHIVSVLQVPAPPSRGVPTPPADRSASKSHPLPAFVTRCIGRTAEVAALSALLQGEQRLITVVGPPGIGKTRLAVATAQACSSMFRDGVIWVPLAQITQPDQLLTALSQRLAAPQQRDMTMLEHVCAAVRARHSLLVLDNCEHIAPALAVVRTMLETAPQLYVLATSRMPLHIYGEQRFQLKPLATHAAADVASARPPALELLAERMANYDHTFTLTTANQADLLAICTLLDGVPLALELVSSKLRSWPAAEILQQLRASLTPLAEPLNGRAAQPASMQVALDWSYQQLSPAAQELAQVLSLAPNGWPLERLAALAAWLGIDQHPLIDELVDASLLQIEQGSDGRRWLRYLFVIRQFMAQLWRQRTDRFDLEQWVAATIIATIEQARSDATGSVSSRAMSWFREDQPNTSWALQWAIAQREVQLAVRCVATQAYFWTLEAAYQEGLQQVEAVLALCDAAAEPSTALGFVWFYAGTFQHFLGAVAAAEASLRRCLDIAQAVGALELCGHAYNVLGIQAMDLLLFAEATHWYEQSLAIWQQTGDLQRQAVVQLNLGTIALRCEDLPYAETAFRESLRQFMQIGNHYMLCVAYNNVGETLFQMQRFAEATTQLLCAYELALQLKNKDYEATICANLSSVAAAQGDVQSALHFLHSAFACFRVSTVQGGTLLTTYDIAAQIYCIAQNWRLSAQLLGYVDHLRAVMQVPRNSGQQRVYAAIQHELPRQLDPLALATALAEGQRLSHEQALRLVLNNSATAQPPA